MKSGIYFMITDGLQLTQGSYLVFYNGLKNENNTIVKYTTSTDDIKVVFSAAVANQTSFELVAGSAGMSGVQFNYDTSGCSVDVSEGSGTLSSPAYVASDLSSVECVYSMTASQYAPRVPAISFQDIRIQNGNVTLTYKDLTTLVYTDGTIQAGDEVNVDSVQVALNTSMQSSFQASYTGVNPACSKKMNLTSGQNKISTAGYSSGGYSNNQRCLYVLSAPDDDMTLEMTITDAQFADQYDRVTINDGNSKSSPLLISLTGGDNKPAYSLLTSGSTLWLEFQSDEVLTARGLEAIVTTKAYGGLQRDSGRVILEKKEGEVRDDPAETTVTFQLTAQPGHQVVLHMNDSVLLPTSTLTISDGLEAQPTDLLATFSSVSPFYTVYSRSSALTIQADGFLVNGSLSDAASFTADFTSRPTPTEGQRRSVTSAADSDSYTLMTPHVGHIQNTHWLILNPNNGTVALKLSSVTVGPKSSVSVFRGLSEQSLKIMEITDSTDNIPLIYVEDGVRVSYDTASHSPNDSSLEDLPPRLLLQASYNIIATCSVNVSGSVSRMTSPNFPDRYPYNAHCTSTYAITAPTTDTTATATATATAQGSVHVYFDDADLDLAPQDSISIQAKVQQKGNSTENGTTTTTVSYGRYTGGGGAASGPSDLIISGEEMSITLDSLFTGDAHTAWNTRNGFSANIRQLGDCGGNVTNSNGSISSPAVTANNTVLCVWIVTIPSDGKQNGSVNIIQYDLTLNGQVNNSKELVVRDGPSIRSEEVSISLDKNNKQQKVLSRYNSLYIQYNTQTTTNSAPVSFTLTYTTYECPLKQQCANGVCMHPDWKCNGLDECGDNTDEQDCSCVPGKLAYKPYIVAVALLCGLLVGAALAVVGPKVYRTIKARRNGEGTGYGNLQEDPAI